MFSAKRTARRHGWTGTLPAALLLIGLAGGTAARADSIPQQYLDSDHKSCVAACTGQGSAPERCIAYCDCSIKAVGEQFTMQEYVLVSQAMSLGQQPPKDSLDKMTAISKACKAGLK